MWSRRLNGLCMSVKIIQQEPSDDLIMALDCNGTKCGLHIAVEAFEDYYGITDTTTKEQISQFQESLTAGVFVYISNEESRGRLKAKYQFLTQPSLVKIIGSQ